MLCRRGALRGAWRGQSPDELEEESWVGPDRRGRGMVEGSPPVVRPCGRSKSAASWSTAWSLRSARWVVVSGEAIVGSVVWLLWDVVVWSRVSMQGREHRDVGVGVLGWVGGGPTSVEWLVRVMEVLQLLKNVQVRGKIYSSSVVPEDRFLAASSGDNGNVLGRTASPDSHPTEQRGCC